MKLSKLDKSRLRLFDGGGMTDGLFDRNFADRMEGHGLLKYAGGSVSGERFFDLTDKGREALAQ